MAVNQTIFDKILRILVFVRAELRSDYDNGTVVLPAETVHFYLDHTGKNVIRGDETDENTAVCTVSWDNTNANLRTLAREIMHGLCD